MPQAAQAAACRVLICQLPFQICVMYLLSRGLPAIEVNTVDGFQVRFH